MTVNNKYVKTLQGIIHVNVKKDTKVSGVIVKVSYGLILIIIYSDNGSYL